jgi:hypothetical protein
MDERMNKTAIYGTAVCRWDEKEKCFIVQSPLYDALKGIAETKEEAWEIFEDFLDDAYTSYLEGRLGGMYAQRGRPAKNRVNVNAQVKPETRDEVKALAAELGCSQGEVIDYVVAVTKVERPLQARKVAAKMCKAKPKSKITAKSRKAKAQAK